MNTQLILASIAVFLVIILLLVVILLVAKRFLLPGGNIKVKINGEKANTEYVSHIVKSNDTLNSLALKYYNNPTFWWVIAYFNDIQDPFKPLRNKYTTLKIPNIASVEFGRINK